MYLIKHHTLRSLAAVKHGAAPAGADDTYNAMSCAGNGKIYYVVSSSSLEKDGTMYVYDPATGKIELVTGLATICGEEKKKIVPQGKSHVRFYEKDGKLYFATHAGYYETVGGLPQIPASPPAGYERYSGGHILSYDLASGAFEDLALAPGNQGIITMTMDTARGQIYVLTWPKGELVHYDIMLNESKNLGPVSAQGEAGIPGDSYRILCRSMFVDAGEGDVYFSTADGDIFNYNPQWPSIQKLEGVDLRRDYFGKYDPGMPGTMAYNWRKITWHSSHKVAYGIHGNSAYLFMFDPRTRTIEVMDRLAPEPLRKSGMFDRFRYGYMGFQLGPDNTLYYLTGAGDHGMHLITYDLADKKLTDHGPVICEDGSRPVFANTIAIGGNGNVYTLARFRENGAEEMNLLEIENPLKKEI